MESLTQFVSENDNIRNFKVTKTGCILAVVKYPNGHRQSVFISVPPVSAEQWAAMGLPERLAYLTGFGAGARQGRTVGLKERDSVLAQAALCGIPASEMQIWTGYAPASVRRILLGQGINTLDMKMIARDVEDHGNYGPSREHLVRQRKRVMNVRKYVSKMYREGRRRGRRSY